MSSEGVREPEPQGVQFRAREGRRSSQHAGKAILASAVAQVEPELARRIESATDWRKSYLEPVRDIVVAGARSAQSAERIARDGLNAVHDELVYVHKGEELTLDDALTNVGQTPLRTVEVRGEGVSVTSLRVPYRGRDLDGEELVDQLGRWEGARVLEPSAAAAIAEVVRHPEWLDLADLHLALIGAASQMGPLEMLGTWRANVVAIDLPRASVWTTILKLARRGAGKVFVPVTGDVDDVTNAAGVDLMTDAPRAYAWLSGFDAPLVIGNYVYADGADFVRLASSVDSLVKRLLDERPGNSVAYLATPTDVFAVPADVVEDARSRTKGSFSVARRVMRPATGSRLFAPNYDEVVRGEEATWGVADCLVPIQGPNYALAKSLQRWRAIVSRTDGTLTSANVAPSTRTTSVVKNRMLAAAYRGAGTFGVEIFEPETSRALMAAKLVHDIRNPGAVANPATPIRHPYELFAEGAVHGGLWRNPFAPRSVLPLALLLGLGKRH